MDRWRFGWLELGFLGGTALVICLSMSPYIGPSPFVIGKWSGTPAVMPAGLEQTAGRFARLDLTNADLSGNIAGTLKVDAVSGPFVGKMYGHHLSLVITSSGLPGPAYYGVGFEGTIRRATIDGTLEEIGTSQWDRQPLNYELSLTPETEN
ncbi:MAG: hypothetical protein JO009_03575 [Candidatus Eremiobacteraeota bacterium]|nr:hypothetical protein [Candidatus Eremiobacteraeota bacterium]